MAAKRARQPRKPLQLRRAKKEAQQAAQQCKRGHRPTTMTPSQELGELELQLELELELELELPERGKRGGGSGIFVRNFAFDETYNLRTFLWK